MAFGFARVRQLDYFWTRLEERCGLALEETVSIPRMETVALEWLAEPETVPQGGVCLCCLRGE